MLISTHTDCWEKYGSHKEVIRMLKDAGFSAFDMTIFPDKIFPLPESFFLRQKSAQEIRETREDNKNHTINEEEAYQLRKYADEIGIVCNQTHAPFPTKLVWNEEYNEFVMPYLIKSVEISGILGAKICVVHPACGFTPEENMQMYNQLKETAKRCNVKIALENMWDWDDALDQAAPTACSHHDDFKRHLDLLNDDIFCACLDLGHAEMRGLDTSAIQMIKTLGSQIQALHIHDTDLHYDLHTLPYLSKVNFAPIWEELKKIGYQGDVTFETYFQKNFPVELYPHCAKLLCEVGKYICSCIE